MGVLGGFIHKVGLVRLGGASALEIDAETTYTQATGNHSSNHPVSRGWYTAVYGREQPVASSSLTSHLCLVSGTLTDFGIDVFTNTTDQERLYYFKINGAGDSLIDFPLGTTGNIIINDVGLAFAKYDSIVYHNSGAGGGNMDHKFTCIIKWD